MSALECHSEFIWLLPLLRPRPQFKRVGVEFLSFSRFPIKEMLELHGEVYGKGPGEGYGEGLRCSKGVQTVSRGPNTQYLQLDL